MKKRGFFSQKVANLYICMILFSIPVVNQMNRKGKMRKVYVFIILCIISLLVLPTQDAFSYTDGEIKELEAKYKERIKEDPKDAASLSGLGQVYWDQDKIRPALSTFRTAIKVNPEYPIPYFFIGKAYFLENKEKKALTYLDNFEKKMDNISSRTREMDAFYVDKLHYLVYVNSVFKNYVKIMDLCKKILKINPMDQEAHYDMAVCYYLHYHKRAMAFDEFEKVIQINSTSRMADMARYAIDYIRSNPSSRNIEDFSFASEE